MQSEHEEAHETITRNLREDLAKWASLAQVQMLELIERSWVLRAPATPTPELEGEFALIVMRAEHLPDLVNAMLQRVPTALQADVMQVFLTWAQTIAIQSLEGLPPIERARRVAEAEQIAGEVMHGFVIQADGRPPH